MKTIVILFKAEFKRFWTLGMILLAVFLVGFGAINPLVMTQTGMYKTLSQMTTASEDMISFFVLLVFFGGIVSGDVKSGWLRTLMTRSVTRQQYLTIKMISAFSAAMIVYLLSFFLPVVYLSFDPKLVILYDWEKTILLLFLIGAKFGLFTILATLISCGMPGTFNGVLVFGWMALSQMIGFLVDRFYWDAQWAVVLKDYLFPSGFDEAMKAIIQNLPFPYSDILWGCAAFSFFLALAFFSINKVVVDTGSE